MLRHCATHSVAFPFLASEVFASQVLSSKSENFALQTSRLLTSVPLRRVFPYNSQCLLSCTLFSSGCKGGTPVLLTRRCSYASESSSSSGRIYLQSKLLSTEISHSIRPLFGGLPRNRNEVSSASLCPFRALFAGDN